MSTQYDIISDIHGHYHAFAALLESMDYTLDDKTYKPPKGRKLLLLGDIINKGPNQKKTIKMVKRMIKQGHAKAIMGNHEFNAICMAEEITETNEDRLRQQAAFLEAYEFGSPKHEKAIELFKQFPLYFETDSFIASHGAPSKKDIKTVAPYLNSKGQLTKKAYRAFTDSKSPFSQSLNRIIKGCKKPNEDETISALQNKFQKAKKPVFVGHYNLSGPPRIISPHIILLDFKDHLTAYRCQKNGGISEDYLHHQTVLEYA